ncbi:MAG TPA: Clp protease N-terminal domain-containing protein, partial [Abditibacteriaceae bacterium]|nr:Clp protease N-terminal domain-containing protein [Abditibacteriaceae bacterium]
MWQRFTERARRVILIGQEEAGKMGSSHVGTEHLLLGLVSEGEGVASYILHKTGVNLSKVRDQINDEAEAGEGESTGSEPKLTPKAKRVLELAADEARHMRHYYIGTEHLLLALLHQETGRAAKVLQALGISLKTPREEVMQYLSDPALGLSLKTLRKKVVQHPIDPAEISNMKFLEDVEELVEDLHVERMFLNEARLWAINEESYLLATLLRDAV